MTRTQLLAAMVLVAASVPVSGEPAKSAKVRLAFSETNYEQMTCIAYFDSVMMCAKANNKPGIEKMYNDASQNMFVKAGDYAGRAGISADAMSSRYHIERANMLKLLKGSCSNISSIAVRHKDRCDKVTKEPLSVVKEHLKKQLAKQ